MTCAPKTKRLPKFTVVRCKMNGHQVGWCHKLCSPVDGVGLCGRQAPHAVKSLAQIAIANYKRSQKQEVHSQSDVE